MKWYIQTAIILILVIALAGTGFYLYKHGKSVGYSMGYAQAIKDRPTYGSVGTVVNNADLKGIGFHLGRGILGYCW
jgi:uncharacterized protein YpmB